MPTQPKSQTDSSARLLAQAVTLHRAGDLEQAQTCYRAVLAHDPRQPDALNMLGMLHAQRGNWEECIRLMDALLSVKPKHADAHYNRGVALKNVGRYEEALASYDRAIAIRRDHATSLSNRAAVLDKLKRYEEALAGYTKAIALKPDFAEAHSNRGLIFEKLNRYDEALASCDKATRLKPDYAEAHNNRGNVLEKLKRYDEALASYDRAIALKPDYANAQWNKGLLKILLGEYEEGWALYEWRWKKSDRSKRIFTQPLWLGAEPVEGKTILLHSEQGLGDIIQFCRYAPMVEALGAKAILEVPASLVGVLATLKGSPQVVAQGSRLPEFDLHCPILSLPHAFKTSVHNVPAEIPYLSADAQKLKAWQKRMGRKSKLRVGVAWTGSTQHRNDHNRSMAFKMLEPLWQVGPEFHSLHKEIGREDAATLEKHGQNIISHAENLKDFSETAALLSEMDLVISVDTSVAHLAGALGRPVWIMLPFAPDYRWMAERHDTPWYPTARLFRQSRPGDWTDVIATVATELQKN